MNNRYIIYEKSEIMWNNYKKLLKKNFKNDFSEIEKLRILIPNIDPVKYKGTGRQRIDSHPFYPDENNKLIKYKEKLKFRSKNLAARKKIAEYEYMKYPESEEEDFTLKSETELLEVFILVEKKELYECFNILSLNYRTDNSLGFDIGYSSFIYSIIADTAIIPTWHPPDFDDFSDLIPFLKKLNEYCLFDDYNTAEAYLNIYKTKKWAEKGEFNIYNVNKVLL